MAKKSNSLWWRGGVILVVIAISWMKYQETERGTRREKNHHQTESRHYPSSRHPHSKHSTSSHIQKVSKIKGFDVLNGCLLIPHRHNDGDSFHVRTPQGEDVEFRLYFVDTPESAAKTYGDGKNNYKRLAQQGVAMGGLTQKETTEVGMQAKHFVKKLLGKQKFRVLTRWENVYGPQRRYAFVKVKYLGKERYLHEILVERGLGRIHTRGANLPDGTTRRTHERFLRKLEKKAKRQKKGAWGM